MNAKETSITMHEETDPAIWAEARARRAMFARNVAWLEAHSAEVYRHRAQFYCISGEQLFVADTVEKALAQARAAHPDDDGRCTGYIPKEKVARIYAN